MNSELKVKSRSFLVYASAPFSHSALFVVPTPIRGTQGLRHPFYQVLYKLFNLHNIPINHVLLLSFFTKNLILSMVSNIPKMVQLLCGRTNIPNPCSQVPGPILHALSYM